MSLFGKKIAFLGDSITEGVGTSGTEHIYCNLIAQKTGALCFNYGFSGTRIAPQHVVAIDEAYETAYFASRVDQMIPDADMIVIFGGTNDYGHGDAALGKFGDKTNDTFYGAYHCLLSKLRQRYPKAQIVVMTPLHREFENDLYNSRGIRSAGALSDYIHAILETAKAFDVTVVDLYHDCKIQPQNSEDKLRFCPDGLHPNDDGHILIADCFLQTV